MLEKNIYFIRHGETVQNAAHIRQDETGGLSETGRQQIQKLGQRLKGFNINKILSSPFQRAVETTDIILQSIDAPVEYVPLLGERHNPLSIVGKKYDDPKVVDAINSIDKSFHDPDYRYEDEENFQDLKTRALKAKEFLHKNAGHNTLCVTHGIFLKMLLCVLIYDKELTVQQYVKLSLFNPVDNGGITLVKYKPLEFFGNPWEILAFNDSAVETKSLQI
jgi:broad specificity phosphatase PhoE